MHPRATTSKNLHPLASTKHNMSQTHVSTIGLYLPKDRRYDLEDIPKKIETSMHKIPRKKIKDISSRKRV